MPFSREFDPIWKRAIKPAIEEDLGNGNYKANRVDVTTISGTIITDILDGIAHATLVFPGISFFSGWR